MKPSPGARQRLDDWLIERGWCENRRQALALLMSGRVRMDGHPVAGPGTSVPEGALVSVLDPANPYASRGGLKLDPVLRYWQIPVKDRVCLDVGASTGGFTDCLLQHGAALVYALDVGKGLLDWSLRNDPRVRVLEGVNAREFDPTLLDPLPTLVTVDVSFISVTQVVAPLLRLRPLEAVVLVKPQFEAPRKEIPSGGVIRDPDLHARIVARIRQAMEELGFRVVAEAASPIKGQKGNLEFFLHLQA